MTRKEQLAYMIGKIEEGLDSPELDKAIRFARRRGVSSNMHVGKSKDWFEEDRDSRVAEWLMGQFIDGYENDHFLAFNSGINLSKSFLEGKY